MKLTEGAFVQVPKSSMLASSCPSVRPSTYIKHLSAWTYFVTFGIGGFNEISVEIPNVIQIQCIYIIDGSRQYCHITFNIVILRSILSYYVQYCHITFNIVILRSILSYYVQYCHITFKS